jgi:hypothetical protein
MTPRTSRPTQSWTEWARIISGRITDKPEIICQQTAVELGAGGRILDIRSDENHKFGWM